MFCQYATPNSPPDVIGDPLKVRDAVTRILRGISHWKPSYHFSFPYVMVGIYQPNWYIATRLEDAITDRHFVQTREC